MAMSTHIFSKVWIEHGQRDLYVPFPRFLPPLRVKKKPNQTWLLWISGKDCGVGEGGQSNSLWWFENVWHTDLSLTGLETTRQYRIGIIGRYIYILYTYIGSTENLSQWLQQWSNMSMDCDNSQQLDLKHPLQTSWTGIIHAELM